MRKSFKTISLVSVAVMGLMAAGCGDVGSDNASLNNRADDNTPAAKPKFKVGDTVNFEAFEVTLKSVEKLTSVGNEFSRSKPADGGVYVAVTYTLKNTGKKPIGMFDGPTLKLIDADGTSYDADLSATTHFSTQKQFNQKVMSDLNPGIRTTDGKVWEVSKDQFDLTTWRAVLDGHEDTPISLQ